MSENGKIVMSDGEANVLAAVDTPVLVGSVPLGQFLINTSEQMAAFDSKVAHLCAEVPTERGKLVVMLRIEVLQPLPRTH